MITYPFESLVLPVIQPIGRFYVTVLPARLLLEVAASDRINATLNPEGSGYTLHGTQRLIQDPRLTQIADYIDRSDSSFPNSIILAANYSRDIGLDKEEIEAIEEEEEPADPATPKVTEAWTIMTKDGREYLHIPTNKPLAAIIDGQHRLFAFAKIGDKARLDMGLICSVFLDLPKPFQAQLFATINSTQKPVDRSLTYELFGYNVSDEAEQFWSPDKLAVFLTRKLATEVTSPLRGRISVAPKRDSALEAITQKSSWKVSTAVVVDGILRLISSNPKRDSNEMHTGDQTRKALTTGPAARDKSVLRQAFVDGNDALIYAIVTNFLITCEDLFWKDAPANSYILKTVGVQALFDILRKLCPDALAKKDIRAAYFAGRLNNAAKINFAKTEYQVPAGSGRSLIRKTIEENLLP